MNWESLIKGLAVLSAIALVAFIGFAAYTVFLDIPKNFAEVQDDMPITLDANTNLKATLDTLETVWEERQRFRFRLKQDPLFLGRVIKGFTYAANAGGESEEDSPIRLTATVVDENPKAIIKYLGKSFVVQAGDYIGKDFKVLKIEKKQVVLDNKGKKLILINKPILELNEDNAISEYSNNTNHKDYDY